MEQNGNLCLLSAKDAAPKPDDPMEDAEALVLAAMDIGRMLNELLENRDLLTQLAGDLTITDADAKTLLASLPANLSSERRAAIEKALSLVRKVAYFWGGKSYVKHSEGHARGPSYHRHIPALRAGLLGFRRLGILQRHRR